MTDTRPYSSGDDEQPSFALAAFLSEPAQVEEFASMAHRLGHDDAQVLPGGCPAAIDWCAENHAAVVVIDLDGEAAPLKAMAELATHCDPTCVIVCLGSHADIDLYRALLHNGALDYLQKPLRLDLLASTLERARNDGHADFARTGRSIAVTACSGGLGTSTVAAGLSLILSEERHIPVAVVDFDRHRGDQSLLLGVSGDAGLAAALAVPDIDLHLLQRAMLSINPRLRLLAQEPAWSAEPVDSHHLLSIGANLCQLFNQVVWDLPAGMPEGVMDVLRHAETRIVLTELTVQAARSTQRLLAEIGDESDGQQLVLVHNPGHGGQATIPQAQFEDYVGRRLDLALAHAGPVLAESLLHGPLRLDRAPGFRQGMLDLADLCAGRKPRRAEPNGLLSRLKSAIGRRAA